MPFTSHVVKRGQRLAHLKDGVFVALLGPGRHAKWVSAGVHDFLPIAIALDLSPLNHTDPLPEDLPGTRILRVANGERLVVLTDGVYRQTLEPGRYRWWDELGEPTLLRFKVQDEPAPLAEDDPLPLTGKGWKTLTFVETALKLRRGVVLGATPAGRYRLWDGSDWEIRAMPRALSPVPVAAPPEPPGCARVDVASHERAVAFINGLQAQILTPGRYQWWPEAGALELLRFDLREPPAPLSTDDRLSPGSNPPHWAEEASVEGRALVLVRDGQPERALPPGRYRAWIGGRWSLKPVPLSLQSLDIAPQDLLTADQVPVRVKPAASVSVDDPVAVLRQPDWPNQVYLAVQLALREVLSGLTLEALVSERESAGAALVEQARARLPALGIRLEVVAIKDVILPGEIKDLINRVTLAKKEAEALAIKRREETAQTRQLANTARLLENNPVLLRLKELEALGELASHIDRLTLVGSGDLVKNVLLRDLVTRSSSEGGD